MIRYYKNGNGYDIHLGKDFKNFQKELYEICELPNKNIYLKRNDILNKQIIADIGKAFPNSKISVQLWNDEDEQLLYNEEETKILVNHVNWLMGKNIEVDFYEDIKSKTPFKLDEILNANRQLDDVVSKINKQKNKDGQTLSQLEKFACVYAYVRDRFVYKKEGKEENPELSRKLISVLNGDRVVCVGISKTLEYLCRKLEIPCKCLPCKMGKTEYENHLICFLKIDDKKYGVSGFYFSDPTNDDYSWQITKQMDYEMNNALFTYQDLGKHLIKIDNIYNMTHEYEEQFFTQIKLANSIDGLSKEYEKIFKILIETISHDIKLKLNSSIKSTIDLLKYMESINKKAKKIGLKTDLGSDYQLSGCDHYFNVLIGKHDIANLSLEEIKDLIDNELKSFEVLKELIDGCTDILSSVLISSYENSVKMSREIQINEVVKSMGTVVLDSVMINALQDCLDNSF